MLSMMKVHNIKPNYAAIAADMGESKLPSRLTSSTQADLPFPDFTHRALGHRVEALRKTADNYLSTMALHASAEATSARASLSSPAKENKRGPSPATPKAKAKSTATAKSSAAKDKAAKNFPLKATTNAGVKKRSAPAAKGKAGSKTEAKAKKAEEEMKDDEGEDNTDATVTDMEADMQDDDEDGQAMKMEYA